MPLQNRVTPENVIEAVSSRGMFMGNRGCLHGRERNLVKQFCSEKRWIICETDFRGRRRALMEPGKYTELFFLDEPTGLAAGHRPCGECRRDRFQEFKAAWTRGNSALGLTEKSGISEVDRQLHLDRFTDQGAKRTHQCRLGELPGGVIVQYSADASPHLWHRHRLFPWSHEGYRAPVLCRSDESVSVLTPASTVNALREGYAPVVSPDVALFLGEE